MTLTDITTRHAARATFATPLLSIAAAANVWRSRRALARLDAHALEDIGISQDSASSEAAKPIWDVPATWRL